MVRGQAVGTTAAIVPDRAGEEGGTEVIQVPTLHREPMLHPLTYRRVAEVTKRNLL